MKSKEEQREPGSERARELDSESRVLGATRPGRRARGGGAGQGAAGQRVPHFLAREISTPAMMAAACGLRAARVKPRSTPGAAPAAAAAPVRAARKATKSPGRTFSSR
jgi:hypothetical protein